MSSGFEDRHIGPDERERAKMLAALGLASTNELVERVVPASIRDGSLVLEPAREEHEVAALLREMASRNELLTPLIGMGYHGTHTPPVVQRNVLEDPGWYTAYTPYQPEISQGRLEALLNFQTMVADLTGMELANASLLDEATAAAEAMAMTKRLRPGPSMKFLVDEDCHPQTIEVLATRAEPLGIELVVGDVGALVASGAHQAFGVLVQQPGSSGRLRDLRPIVAESHAAGALVVVAADLLALAVVRPPGEDGADVVVGSTQRFGVPLGAGGPHAAYLATRSEMQRTLPGRIVGVSVDSAGRPALRLALQTREQHIRRERATSNICTAQVLLAVMAGMYAVWHGPEGLKAIARRTSHLASVLAAGLSRGGFAVRHDDFFDTITVDVPGRAGDAVARARSAGFNVRLVDDSTIGISLDETSTVETVERVWQALDVDESFSEVEVGVRSGIPPALAREGPILVHPVFNSYRSETEMLRYLRRLKDQDLALDRTMIPLGSCTMKLNATTEMVPITLPGFADVHPFAPPDQLDGYRELVSQLEAQLAEITGYDAVSIQPNAGSQGELAGLLAVRGYHRSRGEGHRDVCLIPSSAHGTNAASAVMAGLRVVVVPCDESGNVDTAALRRLAEDHSATLSCLMVTYPSTHGVFEPEVREICDVVHRHGGQVYLDGANLNALVGLAKPGRFGADVSHLNLHKTFCIPHGGGGPGVGPVAVKAHLAEFLPERAGAVSAAPWGSAGILPISWAYITLMGPDGLRSATTTAILSANYVAARLAPHFPVLYTGEGGLVAHECILDLRPITRSTGVTVEDVAKRLIDHGFHAPTMSFPVAGTLMVEPTESESLAELDRFCDAMIAIRQEIDRVGAGEWPSDDNPLRNAPHTAEDLLVDPWPHPYPRELAAYPSKAVRTYKYWPPVGRVDNAYGDRNVFCECPPVESYAG